MVTRSALYPSSPSATLEKNCIEYHVHAMSRQSIALLINFTADGTWSGPRRSLPPPPPEWRCPAGCRIGPRAGWRTACFTAAQAHSRNQSLPAQSFSIASTTNTFCSSQQLSHSHPPSLLLPPIPPPLSLAAAHFQIANHGDAIGRKCGEEKEATTNHFY